MNRLIVVGPNNSNRFSRKTGTARGVDASLLILFRLERESFSNVLALFINYGNNTSEILKTNKIFPIQNNMIGEKNTFYPFSSIGLIPQDLKYEGENSKLIIGNNNIFRENVTVNVGTKGGNMKTEIHNEGQIPSTVIFSQKEL